MINSTPHLKKKLESFSDLLQIMKAVETLEYHDKNYLSGSDKSRSEQKMENIQYAVNLLEEINDYILKD